MGTFSFTYKDKGYEVDSKGFLLDFNSWHENFAEGIAPEVKIRGDTKTLAETWHAKTEF